MGYTENSMKKWNLQSIDERKADELAKQLGLPRLLALLLVARGEGTVDGAAKFLAPKISSLQDPFVIPNIKAAAERVLLAKQRGEKVVVFGDYDVDGVTGTAIVVQTLKLLGLETSYYIPHRYNEGYGLSVAAVKALAASGTNLIVTVDCGVSNVREVLAAGEVGVDVIVTDHHNLPPVLPAAVAIVNPKMMPAGHPSRDLSGSGVAFKFAWALLRTAGIKDSFFLTALLDLAALGTFSDVVPLTGENRVIAKSGLAYIDGRQRIGLKKLAEVANLNGTIGADQIYFGLAPRLNAAGRLEHAGKSVDLLLAEDGTIARQLAEEINKINIRRQETGAKIKEEVFSRLPAVDEGKAIVISGENWNPGVIGIVASQVAEARFRPAVLIGVNDGIGRGSARSVGKLNIFDYLVKCRDLFLDFGGHAGAAGFKIEAKNIPLFAEQFLAEVATGIADDELAPGLAIDAEVTIDQLSLSLVKELQRLAPFGERNPVPVLMLRNLALSNFRTIGNGNKHLKAKFNFGGAEVETIGFGMGSLGECLDYSKRYDLAFNLESNEWNGFESAQLRLIDLKEADAVL